MDTLHVILQYKDIFIVSGEIRIGCPYALSTLRGTHNESASVNCYSYSIYFFLKTTILLKESENWSKNLSERQASWWCSTCCSNSVSLKLSTFLLFTSYPLFLLSISLCNLFWMLQAGPLQGLKLFLYNKRNKLYREQRWNCLMRMSMNLNYCCFIIWSLEFFALFL